MSSRALPSVVVEARTGQVQCFKNGEAGRNNDNDDGGDDDGGGDDDDDDDDEDAQAPGKLTMPEPPAIQHLTHKPHFQKKADNFFWVPHHQRALVAIQCNFCNFTPFDVLMLTSPRVDYIRSIRDPEKPATLEDLHVVYEDGVMSNDEQHQVVTETPSSKSTPTKSNRHWRQPVPNYPRSTEYYPPAPWWKVPELQK
uniref:Uncharacterized protein n=1 Tax=Timema tahoe TaxID=61484 RepID=A0A7R9NYM6_9NEOP|nr:unnamed protein product [Timema tahoe]